MNKYYEVEIDTDIVVPMIYTESGSTAYLQAVNANRESLEKAWKCLETQGWMLEHIEQFGPSWFMSCYMETATTIC